MERRLAGVLALACLGLLAVLVSACGAEGQEQARAAPAARASIARSQVVAPPQPFRFFSPSSFWNRSLQPGAELDPDSAAAIGALVEEVQREDEVGEPPTINSRRWSVPIYRVPAGQPTVRVKKDNGGSSRALQEAWDAVPLPPDAQPAPGSDRHLVVWQPSSDRLWEFWKLSHTPEGWQARWGGAMQNVSTNRGVYDASAWPGATSQWGASASSLSIAGGLITLEDLEDGEINHALAIGIANPRAGVFALPAQRTDGISTSPSSLPEGAHLRLDPNLRLTELHLPPLTLRIAEAAQRYGIVVRSRASHLVFYAQDPTGAVNPYLGPGGFFEGEEPSQLLAQFPWSHLELLKMTLKQAR